VRRSIDRITDLVASVLFIPAAPFLFMASRKRWSLRTARRLQDAINVTVLRNHYYEPVLTDVELRRDAPEIRDLPGIDWNYEGQLTILRHFSFGPELRALNGKSVNGRRFDYDNRMFGLGDAEALYSFVRAFRPSTIIEVGAGYSTMVARLAIEANREEDQTYQCRHICYEPFENPWLDGLGAEIRREKIEDADVTLFGRLMCNDIVFIDSSHVLRARGDVEREFLRILPALAGGVFVHVHDVFSPRDYPKGWLVEQRRFWTEQYFLEAFLTLNDSFEVVLALNQLFHQREPELFRAFPCLGTRLTEPGSFWIRRKPDALCSNATVRARPQKGD
jgi:hypothetical protein